MISEKRYDGDGTRKIFPVEFKILGENFIRVSLDGILVNDKQTYDIINNSIVFNDDNVPPIGVKNVILHVATSEAELGELSEVQSNIDIVANDINNLNSIATDKPTLDSIFADKATLDSLYNDKTILDSLYASKSVLDALHADLDSIQAASVNATNAQLKSWEATAAHMTADSYATEAKDVPVKIYTSNGIGGYTSVDSSEFSALHYASTAKATVNLQLEGLTDVEVSGKTDNSFLQYDSASDKWIPREMPQVDTPIITITSPVNENSVTTGTLTVEADTVPTMTGLVTNLTKTNPTTWSFQFTAPDVTDDGVSDPYSAIITARATQLGQIESDVATKTINYVFVAIEADDAKVNNNFSTNEEASVGATVATATVTPTTANAQYIENKTKQGNAENDWLQRQTVANYTLTALGMTSADATDFVFSETVTEGDLVRFIETGNTFNDVILGTVTGGNTVAHNQSYTPIAAYKLETPVFEQASNATTDSSVLTTPRTALAVDSSTTTTSLVTTGVYEAGDKLIVGNGIDGYRDVTAGGVTQGGGGDFDTVLWTGNSASRVIEVPNLSGNVDFAWIKSRSGTGWHALFDSNRGTGKRLSSNSTGAELTEADGLTAFGEGQFSLGADSVNLVNKSGDTYVAWTASLSVDNANNTNGSIPSVTKTAASGFMSAITYTGTGANATVGHGLGVAPELVLYKDRDNISNWDVFNTTIGAGNRLQLEATNASNASATSFNNTNPTSSVMSIGTNTNTNRVSADFIAYAFTSIAGVCKIDTYEGNGVLNTVSGLGFEPGWIIVKNVDNVAEWAIFDASRGDASVLYADLSNAESTSDALKYRALADGFSMDANNWANNRDGNTYIYMAIAKADPLTYTSTINPSPSFTSAPKLALKKELEGTTLTNKASDEFEVNNRTASGGSESVTMSNIPKIDFLWAKNTNNTGSTTHDHSIFDSIRTNGWRVRTNDTGAQNDYSANFTLNGNNSYTVNNDAMNQANSTWVAFAASLPNVNATNTNGSIQSSTKANSFMSAFTYAGTGVDETVGHGLELAPDMVIYKRTNGVDGWKVYNRTIGASGLLELNTTGATTTVGYWGNTHPDSSVVTLSDGGGFNTSGGEYVAYAFTSVEGVCKVGSYEGDGSTSNSTVTGFEPQWILIKRTDVAANWTIYDNKRDSGMTLYPDTSGVEDGPIAMSFNSDGFTIKHNNDRVNNAVGTYIYLAIGKNAVTNTLNKTTFQHERSGLVSTGDKIVATVSGTKTELTPSSIVESVGSKLGANSEFEVKLDSITTGTPTVVTFENLTAVDFCISKARNQAFSWNWSDSVRGSNELLVSNNTNAETTLVDRINFSGNSVEYKDFSTSDIVAYGVELPILDSNNTAGSIPSVTRTATSGFMSIISYNGTGGAGTLGHGLSSVPDLVIYKNRDSVSDWVVIPKIIEGSASPSILQLNSTAALNDATNGSMYNMTSTTLNLTGASAWNNGTDNHIAYAFTSIPGVCKVGSYSGNAGNNPITGLGFEPGWVMVKRTDGSGTWTITDNQRGSMALLANVSDAESDYGVQFTSDGFTLTTASTGSNASGTNNYIYLAIAKDTASDIPEYEATYATPVASVASAIGLPDVDTKVLTKSSESFDGTKFTWTSTTTITNSRMIRDSFVFTGTGGVVNTPLTTNLWKEP